MIQGPAGILQAEIIGGVALLCLAGSGRRSEGLSDVDGGLLSLRDNLWLVFGVGGGICTTGDYALARCSIDPDCGAAKGGQRGAKNLTNLVERPLLWLFWATWGRCHQPLWYGAEEGFCWVRAMTKSADTGGDDGCGWIRRAEV